ncbi:flavin reductase family protein [Labrenzia sp. CE80]|uniref:flavin reductase family protein n=1 Tax=Labrenzia sp. CE80 TaxID=1788986 RepID=UPI00138A0CE4|nr:flavin reductase family protein [Labrenzia sp. CE80]
MPTDQIDTRVLRDIMGQFATGVTIITTLGDNGAPVGMAANSFASVSLDPPLVVWSIDLNAPSLSAFRTHPSFAINIMCEDSKDLVMNFAKPSDNKFADVSWQAGLDGVPVLDAASTVIQCRTENRIEGGDHEMYLGRVIDCHKTDKAPLIFHKGKFAKLGNLL